ncbi:ABC transporter substrate-binding protein [uncultured Ruminococcus sp.]|jgi:raffinose/stachyose/melibiose transport system substrate-binding protein|uniref:ABC transporter substrate-binding protein n=1 Tax=uncultured Ruminococcus sp. TaxID=165186 RepID=UPI002618B92E|nr:extracellular solute-binding protein [uncultured Ruminococcus sp.]
MNKRKCVALGMALVLTASSAVLTGCGSDKTKDGRTIVTMLQYKPEAVSAFDEMAERFNASQDEIYLEIESPNDAMTVLKTRFVREDYPDIIGIGGDINYSNFLDANMFMDISDFDGISDIKPAYMDIVKELEFIPQDGVHALPYVANCAGILYNKDMFEENGWEIPTTWSEFTALCDTISESGVAYPLYMGYKDTWTCMAPWNALAVGLTPPDVCSQVNAGNTTFTEQYAEVAEKEKALLQYAEPNPYAYSYNDACTAFARGESAMFPIGSYAVPQIQSVNPDINIDSFTFPANENAEDNVLNSGVDLLFAVMKESKNKEAVYKVLDFMFQDDTIQIYLDNQSAVPCKEGDFTLPSILDGMKQDIDDGNMADFHDHHYPTEMSVDAMIQTYLMDDSDNSTEKFLKRFDKDWKRYNRDLIEKVQKYEQEKEGN